MTGKEILAEAKEKMAKSGDALKRTLADIRAGRANASLLNTVTVEYYGARRRLTNWHRSRSQKPANC